MLPSSVLPQGPARAGMGVATAVDRGRHGQVVASLAALCAAGGMSLGAFGQCQYEVTIFDGPPCKFGGGTLQPAAINDMGHVVGRFRDCDGDEKGFLWTPERGLVRLTTPDEFRDARAMDVNNAGQIVGRATFFNTLSRATLWENGEVRVLGTLPGDRTSEAFAINSHGQIVGSSFNNVDGPMSAFLWEDGEMRKLDLPLKPWAAAHDISDAGYVVGWMGARLSSHAFRWRDGEVIDLGVIPGGESADGLAVNNLGEVAGFGWVPDPLGSDRARHAFLWRWGRMRDLGLFPGFLNALATGISDSGQVVGANLGIGVPRPGPFIWQDGVMTNLNDLIPMATDIRSQLRLSTSSPPAINKSGQIVLVAFELGDQNDAFVAILTPLRETPGDTTGDCRVGIPDLVRVLSDWGPCDACPSDLNEDGIVGMEDLELVLTNWS